MLNILLTMTGVLILFLLWMMIYDSTRFVVRNYGIKDKRIKKACRMVVVADLHGKSYGRENELLVRAIKAQKPDFIVVAGDILTAKPKRKLDSALHFMERINEICPIYYGNGNHEHRLQLYPQTYGTMAEEYEAGLKRIGIERLVNEHTFLKEKGIVIYGSQIDRYYYKRFRIPPMEEHYLESLLGEPDESWFTILIAHNPDYFKNYVNWGADLALAGHVHGGIIRIPFVGKGLLSPNVRFFPKYDGGEFRDGNRRMIVSRGLGSHTIPFRLFNPGELVVVDFETV